MKYVNKIMVVVINKMVIHRVFGTTPVGTNIRPGLSLGFIEHIHTNSLFGTKIYPSLFHQAAAYMYFIIKNHVFIDGNKRTGLATAVTFLEWNSYQLGTFDEDNSYNFVNSVADGDNSPEEMIPRIAEWFQNLCG